MYEPENRIPKFLLIGKSNALFNDMLSSVPKLIKLLKSIDRCNSDSDAVERVGIQYATEQCSDLLNNGVDGIHFYTLNKSKSTRGVFEALGINKT